MYSNIKNVQLLIALLKKFKVRKIVISPGGSDIPLVHSVEEDDFFDCFSVVDERSAVYFAMGLAQEHNKPVACMCTSGTAVSNYLPGLTEAYYQNVPIVAITADKNPYFINNLEIQKIEQSTILNSVCKKNVDLLPRINTEDESWYCQKLINEALMEMTHHGNWPVQINIPIVDTYSVYDCKKLPAVKKMQYIGLESNKKIWGKCIETLEKAKNILVIVGQDIVFEDEIIQCMEEFFENFNCIFATDYMSNLNCKGALLTYPIIETNGRENLVDLIPDLVISMGNNIASYNTKPFIRENRNKIEHWQIDEAGRVRDPFMCLTNIYECSIFYFLNYFNENSQGRKKNKNEYYFKWQEAINSFKMPELEFSSIYVAQELSKVIPSKSVLHLAILSSTRIMQFFKLKNNIRVYSNIGALGIDGCLSTFMGQSVETDELAFCVIGDLSYFYDMNASGIRHVKNNVRIILLNNGGGSEFQFFMDKKTIPTLDSYICAEHQKHACEWMNALGYQTYCVENKTELNKVLQVLADPSEAPIFVEISTDMENDAKIIKNMYNVNSNKKINAEILLKKAGGLILGPKQKEKLKKVLNKNHNN